MHQKTATGNKATAEIGEMVRVGLPATDASFDLLETCVGSVLERVEGLTQPDAAEIVQAVRQAFERSVYTASAKKDEQGEAVLSFILDNRRLVLKVDDIWEQSFSVSGPPVSEGGEGWVAHAGLGVGLFLTRQLMDQVTYEPQSGNNRWRLVKDLPGRGEEAYGPETPYTVRFDLPATHKYLNLLSAGVSRMVRGEEATADQPDLEHQVQLAVQETANNIVDHAYAGEAGRIEVTATLTKDHQQLIIEMRDTGRHTFQLSSVPDPFGAPELPIRGLLTGGAVFFISAAIVNLGNYLFNLIMGRQLGPEGFADLSLIVTLFLVASFVAAGFQQAAAKFSAAYSAAGDSARIASVRRWLGRWAWLLGVALLVIFAFGSPLWMRFFHTQSFWPFVLLGIGVPLYVAQGVDRGVLQGQTKFGMLALSYQAEMWVRLIVAVGLVALGFSVNGAVGGLVASFLVAWWVVRRIGSRLPSPGELTSAEQRTITMFTGAVAVAEVGQILINNSDMLLVKHFFTPATAGFYAALSMVGRTVFFATRSVVAAMFPIVAQKQERHERHEHLLAFSLGLVAVAGLGIIVITAIIPEFLVKLLFGEEYLSIAPLVWLYALTTALYALANVIINYRLSLGDGRGSVLAAVAGVAQVVGLWIFHEDLRQVVIVQVVLMAVLLVGSLGWQFWAARSKGAETADLASSQSGSAIT